MYWLRRICYKRWHTESEQVTDTSLGYFPLSLFDCYSRSVWTQETFRITWNTTSSAGSSLYFLRYFTFFPHPSKNHFSHLFSSVLNHAASAAFPLFPLFFDAIGLQLSTMVFYEAAFHSSQVDWFLTGEEQVYLQAGHSPFHRTTCWAFDTCSKSLPQEY